ncbi:hypothetical protein I7I48_04341 [Histoplasma ohiense]|nr:hypothetical protein I7I48_04341 [Histoplasma ohiense (nom. inval.)]
MSCLTFNYTSLSASTLTLQHYYSVIHLFHLYHCSLLTAVDYMEFIYTSHTQLLYISLCLPEGLNSAFSSWISERERANILRRFSAPGQIYKESSAIYCAHCTPQMRNNYSINPIPHVSHCFSALLFLTQHQKCSYHTIFSSSHNIFHYP